MTFSAQVADQVADHLQQMAIMVADENYVITTHTLSALADRGHEARDRMTPILQSIREPLVVAILRAAKDVKLSAD